jgi:hypothetical protein
MAEKTPAAKITDAKSLPDHGKPGRIETTANTTAEVSP